MPLVRLFERGPLSWIFEGIERFELNSKQNLAGWELDDVCIEESVSADMHFAVEDHDETAAELSDDAGEVDQETGWVLSLGNTNARSRCSICLLPGDCHPPARCRLGFSRQRGSIIAAPLACLAERLQAGPFEVTLPALSG